MHTSLRRALAASVLLVVSGVWAGEIIVSPEADSNDQSVANAETQKNRARAFRKDRMRPAGDPKNTTILILPGEEGEGMLSPGRNSAESPAAENRQRAAESRKPDAPREILILTPPPAGVDTATTTAEKAHDNRVKARAYSKQRGDRPLGVGADGVPYIDCGDAGSVAGRIGDDTHSGNVVTIIRDNRVIKARCL